MKNFIPLVLAVLLGLSAVLAVGRLLQSRKQAVERTASVVAVARDVTAGEVLTADSVMEKRVPVSARPAQAIFWSRSEMVVWLTWVFRAAWPTSWARASGRSR